MPRLLRRSRRHRMHRQGTRDGCWEGRQEVRLENKLNLIWHCRKTLHEHKRMICIFEQILRTNLYCNFNPHIPVSPCNSSRSITSSPSPWMPNRSRSSSTASSVSCLTHLGCKCVWCAWSVLDHWSLQALLRGSRCTPRPSPLPDNRRDSTCTGTSRGWGDSLEARQGKSANSL